MQKLFYFHHYILYILLLDIALGDPSFFGRVSSILSIVFVWLRQNDGPAKGVFCCCVFFLCAVAILISMISCFREMLLSCKEFQRFVAYDAFVQGFPMKIRRVFEPSETRAK